MCSARWAAQCYAEQAVAGMGDRLPCRSERWRAPCWASLAGWGEAEVEPSVGRSPGEYALHTMQAGPAPAPWPYCSRAGGVQILLFHDPLGPQPFIQEAQCPAASCNGSPGCSGSALAPAAAAPAAAIRARGAPELLSFPVAPQTAPP
jgi:hypothetical protein